MVQIDIEKPKRCFDCQCCDFMHKGCALGPSIDDMNTVAPDCPMKEVDGDEDHDILLDDLFHIDQAYSFLSDIGEEVCGLNIDCPTQQDTEQWIKDGYQYLNALTVNIARWYLNKKMSMLEGEDNNNDEQS